MELLSALSISSVIDNGHFFPQWGMLLISAAGVVGSRFFCFFALFAQLLDEAKVF